MFGVQLSCFLWNDRIFNEFTLLTNEWCRGVDPVLLQKRLLVPWSCGQQIPIEIGKHGLCMFVQP